ncbi:MAG: hypothetical protein ABIJ19_01195 [Patescibacteria group bacterium]
MTEFIGKEKFLVLVRFSEGPKKEWHHYVVGRVTRIGKLGGITLQAIFKELFDGSLVLGQNIDSVQKVILKEIVSSV